MINQFIEELANLEKEYNKEKEFFILQTIHDTLKIFYDYTEEIDNKLSIALKYMIKNNKRPLYSYTFDNFYWARTTSSPVSLPRDRVI